MNDSVFSGTKRVKLALCLTGVVMPAGILIFVLLDFWWRTRTAIPESAPRMVSGDTLLGLYKILYDVERISLIEFLSGTFCAIVATSCVWWLRQMLTQARSDTIGPS